jgi:hypothetical protein
MKPITVASIVVLPLVLFSCSDDGNPIASVETQDYLGGIGTQRSYDKTERWLIPGTNEPYYSVPDSLRSRISVNNSQLDSGVSFIYRYNETVRAIDDDFYSSWHLDYPRVVYRQIDGQGSAYSLADELDALSSGASYSPSSLHLGTIILRDTADAIMTVAPNQTPTSPSVAFMKKSLRIGDSWTRNMWIDTSGTHMRIETVAQVVALTTVTVPSGTYSAYQVHLTTYHFNPDYHFDEGYEYYAPNVGLILKESDILLSQWNSQTNQTVSFRQVIRQELLSVDFVR